MSIYENLLLTGADKRGNHGAVQSGRRQSAADKSDHAVPDDASFVGDEGGYVTKSVFWTLADDGSSALALAVFPGQGSRFLPGSGLSKAPSIGSAADIAHLETAGFFSSIIKWIADKIASLFAPPEQWNIVKLFGSAETAHSMLAKYNGAGVHVADYDDGIDKSVAALMTHYDASRELVINGIKADPGILTGAGQGVHGTATNGIIATDPTKTGGRVTGIANGAWLTDVNVFSGPAATATGYLMALQQMVNFDVTNNSYGSTAKWSELNLGFYSYGNFLISSLEYVGNTGRGGLGTIIVKSAGNNWSIDHRDAGTQAFNVDRHVVTVGAMDSNDTVSYYSQRGASLLTCAPSNGASKEITTTDRTGTAGYSDSNITTTFGGTSAAAPEVTAVVADMLGANGKLGARDVQAILALASHDNETAWFTTAATHNMAYGWTVNHAAGAFNGGGYHFSNDEGFGELNAHDAIREAAVWSYMNPTAQTYNNEVHLSAAAKVAAPPTTTGASFTFDVTGDETVENADLTLNVSTANLNNLKVVLTGPSGTQSIVLDSSVSIKDSSWVSYPGGVNVTLSSHAFLGESAHGTWKAQVFDSIKSDLLSVNGATLDLYGSATSQAHIFHYTDEAFKMVASDWSRLVLHDNSGVGDWVDTAMMTGTEALDLRTGGISFEDGAPFLLVGSDTVVNNATLGDGRCTVRCNDKGDTIVAGNGTAFVTGGAGNDTFIAGSGSETIWGGGGRDNFVFDHRGFGAATITDFTQGDDHLDLRGLGLSFANLKIADNGSTIAISNFDPQGDVITLLNSHNQHLTAGDFLFA